MKKSFLSYLFLIFLILTFLAGTYVYSTGQDFVFAIKENITNTNNINQHTRSSSNNYVSISNNPYDFIPENETIKYMPVTAHSNLYIADSIVFTPTTLPSM